MNIDKIMYLHRLRKMHKDLGACLGIRFDLSEQAQRTVWKSIGKPKLALESWCNKLGWKITEIQDNFARVENWSGKSWFVVFLGDIDASV